jgi:hypothetical protein
LARTGGGYVAGLLIVDDVLWWVRLRADGLAR